MSEQQEDRFLMETSPIPIQEVPEDRAITETVLPLTLKPIFKISKPEIRKSLKALTLESVFATIFYSIISGALLSNFLLKLGAGAIEIGLLASIPQVLNLLQPLGAYLIDRTTSFRWYAICVFTPSRLLWVILLPAIWLVTSSRITEHQVIYLTLAIITVANIIESLGRAPWLGWIAVLVPQRLRGRYFGFRNSILSLINLIGVPLLGFTVSAWPSGTLQGYGAVLALGIVLGLISQICQWFITDVNPQLLKAAHSEKSQVQPNGTDFGFLKDANFLKFLFYLAIWCFAVNLSAPFFNLYMLDNLNIDISAITIYHGLGIGANMLMLLLWGKLADRIGNRPILTLVGFLVGITPLLWLGVRADEISLWIWLPLLHVLAGGTWAAIDLCTNNLMMGVAPLASQSKYFAIAGAIAGVTGAIGITTGSLIAMRWSASGLLLLFVLSGILRLIALLPLVFVQEKRSVPLVQLWRVLLPNQRQKVLIQSQD